MRILFVIGNLSDYHVPRYRALVRLAAARGDELSLVEVFGKSGLYAYAQEQRAAFFDDAPPNCVTLLDDASENDRRWMAIGSRLFAILRRTAPDVVVTLGYNTIYSVWLCALKKVIGGFGLVYMSDSKADDGKRRVLKEWVKRVLVSQFDGALVAGEKHRVYASSLGIPLTHSRIGFDVIDVEYFAAAASRARDTAATVRLAYDLPPRYVLCVSRFVPRKNVDLVVDAFARAGLASHGISLVLVGQGPLEDELRQRIARLGLDACVRIVHAIPNRSMPALYTLAEFVVLASEFDQWGLCISEALAAGRPAIVTRTCGVADELVRDNVNGYIVEPGDTAALATRMRLLGRNRVLRERFARNAHAQVRSWTPDLFAANLAGLADMLARPVASR